ncbi:hypothetical protein [Clostridium chromiireducens]|uniref:Uncharacterized protein n=1 Tax=Clostridium chromiireducens TaxID=225345 RepID=A0A1V4IVT9_9CLOT|nr:hypothetical protein [Clostridium chromiireducens]MVX67364.1 hypothetical protein [Clostridium chromiireducens]OPJ63894.1 hypothetical protein CLCHR_14130 [Clostridium chromiireducens]RII35706.1 hypothetical protein D2A34_11080 [Clostridium chromiireducens]
MNRFDRAVNKKTSDLITKNLLGQDVTEEDFKKFRIIARAMIREEARNIKTDGKHNSLHHKTWKNAAKYGDFQK